MYAQKNYFLGVVRKTLREASVWIADKARSKPAFSNATAASLPKGLCALA